MMIPILQMRRLWHKGDGVHPGAHSWQAVHIMKNYNCTLPHNPKWTRDGIKTQGK